MTTLAIISAIAVLYCLYKALLTMYRFGLRRGYLRGCKKGYLQGKQELRNYTYIVEIEYELEFQPHELN